MRALHFFEENKRVEEQVKALRKAILRHFCRMSPHRAILPGNGFRMSIRRQTCRNRISIAPGIDRAVYQREAKGACRIHGGGFAGVIMVMLPNGLVDEYVEYIEGAIGEGNAYRMSIRPYGAICVSERCECCDEGQQGTDGCQKRTGTPGG